MPKYGGGRKTNVEGLVKARSHLLNLKDDIGVRDATSTTAGRAINSILYTGEDAMRKAYRDASGNGVENTDQVKVKKGVYDNWARLVAEGDKLFFAEFGAGVNLNGGTPRGAEYGYDPRSWSLGEKGKGFLEGNRFAVFKGWWPVKKRVPNAEFRQFVSLSGDLFTRRVVQGNAPVNAAEAASKAMRDIAAKTMKWFFDERREG